MVLLLAMANTIRKSMVIPWSHHGIFVGFSPHHSSLVPLVLNTQTGKISPQVHLCFDDWFMSVASVGGDDTFNPTQWQQLFTYS